MNILSSFTLLFLYFLITPLYSVSAPPFPYEVEQPDGSKIPVQMYGHEYYNLIETEDGYVIDWVEDDERLGWYYSELDDEGRHSPTHILVEFPAPINLDIPTRLRETFPKVRDFGRDNPNLKSLHQSHLGRASSTSLLRPLVFLVDFEDLPAGMPDRIYDKEQFQHLLFDTDLNPNNANLPSGYDLSVRDYYNEISNGNLEIYGNSESIVDWTSVSQNYSYYVDGAQGTGGGSNGIARSAATLVVEIAMEHHTEINFSDFDGDGDGAVDVIILVVEGWGDGDDDQFWPHMSLIHSSGNGIGSINSDAPTNDDGFFYLDGVAIKKYIVITEQYYLNHQFGSDKGWIYPVGTICHELGHVLGLPDLYDTSENSAAGIGEWGLMGSGNWQIQTSPAYMNAWSRYRLGFINPLIIENITNAEEIILPAETGGVEMTSMILPMDSNMPQEYLILENRQKIGADQYLEESGLLVWHIDETITGMYPAMNSVNVNPEFYGVNLLQADGEGDLYSGTGNADSKDTFPGSLGITRLTGSTNPNSNIYSYDRDADGIIEPGGDSNIGIVDIVENSDNSITFKVTNPNQQGKLVGYDEGGYDGISYSDSYSSLQWAGIRMIAQDTGILSGVQTVFPPSFWSWDVTDFTVNIWTGWTSKKPMRLLHSFNGDVNWNTQEMRDGGWVHLSLAEKNIIWNAGDTYYVEINYNGFGGVYPFDKGVYSNSTGDNMSYYRGNTQDECNPFSNLSDGDWNIRVTLNTDFCDGDNELFDCDGNCVVDECGICNGPGAIYDCGCQDLAEFSCDCNGNIEDCAGVCGGSTVVDECGVCGGDGFNCMAINPNMVPDQFNLFQNYPNPFNPTTQIRYDISQYSMVSLKIYDTTGRLSAVLFNGHQSPGQYTQIWDGRGYSSSLYFLELIISSENQPIFRGIKKILYIQ